MNVRLMGLVLGCASPWIYLLAVFLLGPSEGAFVGLKTIPFFALLSLKEQLLLSREERNRQASRDEPYWKMPLYIVGALIGGVVLVFVLMSTDALRRLIGDVAAMLAGGIILASLFLWDVKRVYAKAKGA